MMNKKNLIKTIVLTILILAPISKGVKAAEVCNNYYDYYLYNTVSASSSFISPRGIFEDQNLHSNVEFRSLALYLPATDGKNISQEIVCLGEKSTSNSCITNLTLEEAYSLYKKVSEEGNKDTVHINDPFDKEISYYKLSTKNSNKEVTNYYLFNDSVYTLISRSNNVPINADTYKINYLDYTIQDLKQATIIPSSVSFKATTSDDDLSEDDKESINEIIKGTGFSAAHINTKILPENLTNINEIYFEDNSIVLIPTVILVKYQKCSEAFNVTINYYYKDTNQKIDFENNTSNPYTVTGLEKGETLTVNSPSLKNCIPDKEKVVVEVKDTDITQNVYYTCSTDENINNPQTGTIMLYIAYILGGGALCYSVYYYIRQKKKV